MATNDRTRPELEFRRGPWSVRCYSDVCVERGALSAGAVAVFHRSDAHKLVAARFGRWLVRCYCDIVRRFSEGQHRVVTLRRGPRRGFSRNFLSLVCASDIAGDYFAFSDQDDIWNKDKLERALNWLTTIPQEVPAVYCSRTKTVDDAGNRLGFSPLFTKPPGFRNAIVQNVGGGNTMAFNASARSLLAAIGDVEVVSHDWWTYQITSAAGGLVRYDPQPSIRYRQHANNAVGSGNSMLARLHRVRMLFAGRFMKWNDLNINALSKLRSRFDPINLEVLDQFILARKSPNL